MSDEKVTFTNSLMNINVIVKLRKRSYFERVKILPKIFIQHYRLFREYNPVFISLYCAFILSKLLLKRY